MDKKTRFNCDCIQEICQLDDLEFVELIYEYFHPSVDVVRDAIMKATTCCRCSNVIYFVSKHPNLKEDDILRCDMAFTLANFNWSLFKDIVSHQQEKETIMYLLKQVGRFLYFAHETLQKDKEVVILAVKQNVYALQYVDDCLRKDKEIVMEAVKHSSNAFALQYIDASVRKDKAIMMDVVKLNSCALQYVHESLQKDEEIVMEAVKQKASTLEFADESLRKDKDIVMTAVKQDGFALSSETKRIFS